MQKLLAQATAPAYVDGFSADVIENSKFTFASLIRYQLASMVLLADQGLVPRARARRTVGALFEVLGRGADGLNIDPNLEDLVPNVERAVVELIGAEDAGDLGIARARAEFGHVAAHLALREETLSTLSTQLQVNRTLLGLAGQHLDSIIPYYTQHMRAEPITFGYYFSSFSEAFLNHAHRMRDTYARFAVSPAGVGHIVPTPLPIDRKRLADLLGLGKPVHHSLYAYLNGDLYVDVLSVAAISAASVSRLCLDFWWWNSNELEIIRFADEWCGGSFIMPHKRNPSWLKALRFKSMGVKARCNEAQELWMHGAPMLLVGSLTIPWKTHEGLAALRYCCELLCGAMSSMEIDAARGRAVLERDFVQSSQLVSMIVARGQASWRQAEHVIGQLIKEAFDAGRMPASLEFERLLEIGQTMLGRTLTLDRDEFANALDVRSIVASRGDCGPAPDAVAEAVESQEKAIGDLEHWAQGERSRIDGCWKRVEELARQI